MNEKTQRNKTRRANRRVRPSYSRNREGHLVREDGFVLSRVEPSSLYTKSEIKNSFLPKEADWDTTSVIKP